MAVKHYQADLGLAFDGDGDRLGVIDSNGKIIWPDRQMMLYAPNVLAARPGAEIIFDVKCIRHLAGQIKKYGGRPTLWKTGHSLMKAKLQETGAALAGEMSGHIFFNDRWFGFDDALYTAARLIEILSEDTPHQRGSVRRPARQHQYPGIECHAEGRRKFRIHRKAVANRQISGRRSHHDRRHRVDFPTGLAWCGPPIRRHRWYSASKPIPESSLREIQRQFRQLMQSRQTRILSLTFLIWKPRK